MKLTIDFETRSPAPLADIGMWKYAENPHTDIMCLAVKVDIHNTRLWLPEHMQKFWTKELLITSGQLVSVIGDCDIIEAHNMEFEQAIWYHIMHLRYGFPELPFEKLRCSAAKAAVVGLPRALGKAAKILGLKNQKDDAGNKIMRKLCVPRKAGKKEAQELCAQGCVQIDELKWLHPESDCEFYLWNEEPDLHTANFAYCGQDVETEHELSDNLPDLTPWMQRLWQVDQIINHRGMLIDTMGCQAMIEMCEGFKEDINFQIRQLTQGRIQKGSCVAQIVEFLNENGVKTPNLDKEQIETLLDNPDLPDTCRKLIELRQIFAKSSVSKYAAMLDRQQTDGRIRSTLLFHGAHTGRWAGQGVQTHNLPSRDIIEDAEFALEVVKTGATTDLLDILWDSPLKVASSCVRPVIMADAGKEFFCVDYNAIEGRILAWLADERAIVQGYIDGKCMYKVAFATASNVPYEDVTKDQRQIGKVIELACGYQGWIGAFHKFQKNYDLSLPDDQIKEIILGWRDNRKMTVDLWAGVYEAAVMAMEDPGRVASYGKISFRKFKDHLQCRLPSGRVMWYPFAQLRDGVTPWGKPVRVLSYLVEDSQTKQWMRKDTYGGKLVENIVQGIAMDVMSVALVNLTDAGFNVVLHVHDEIVCEEWTGTKDIDEMSRIMCVMPPWANGLPLVAKGWVGPRYRK